jgi:hypothetical protein
LAAYENAKLDELVKKFTNLSAASAKQESLAL